MSDPLDGARWDHVQGAEMGSVKYGYAPLRPTAPNQPPLTALRDEASTEADCTCEACKRTLEA